MMPIVDKYSDMGAFVMGKVESGMCLVGQRLALYPNKTEVKVDQLWSDGILVEKVSCGENIKVKLKGVEDTDISVGFVLCDDGKPVNTCSVFDARILILDYDSIISNGKKFALHLHSNIKEVMLDTLICHVDKKTGEKYNKRPNYLQQDQLAIARFFCEDVICMETFLDQPKLGRFTLRDGGKSVGIGKVLKLVK
jgi:peptide chain release factor subunit 3